MAVKVKGAHVSLSGTLLVAMMVSGCGSVKDMRDSLIKAPETYEEPAATPSGQDVEVTRAAAPSGNKSLEKIEVYGGNRSQIIETLISRRSLISNGSAFDQVARAVLASDARTAESELRAARLRARSEQFNWLPKIGPNISLSSLGDFVASLVVEQVIFDNGRKKAERDYAAHDVEAAAVGLSQDTNARVGTALSLYITAERARHEKRVAQSAHKRMSHFVNIIQQRVDGGVSNMADLRVAESKLHELDAEIARATEAELTAVAELAAMAQKPMSGVSGMGSLASVSVEGRTPLSVLMARAEGERKVAEAQIQRAAMLPGVTAGGTVGEDSQIGINVSGEGLVGVGTGAALNAVEASKDAARRGVRQAEEDNSRIVNRLHQRRAALRRQEAESKVLVADARKTYELFHDQFKNSGRPIMDVVSIFENAIRLERDSVRLKYELSAIEVEMASMYGNLVNGGDV